MLEPPFHDDSRPATVAAILARICAVATEATHGAYVDPLQDSFQICRVWSRHERPVALIGLGYDWIRVEFADGFADVRLDGGGLDGLIARAEIVLREQLARAEQLGPRAPDDVAGDEPSHRGSRDAEAPGESPAAWSAALLDRLLTERGFGPGRIDVPVLLPALTSWLGQAAPRAHSLRDQITFELYHCPGDDSTACADPPETLPAGEWIGLGFVRALQEVDGIETSTVGEQGVQLWFPPDDDWHALLPTLHLEPVSVVSYERFGLGGSWATWLLEDPEIVTIFEVAARKRAALACRWSDLDEWDIPGAPDDHLRQAASPGR